MSHHDAKALSDDELVAAGVPEFAVHEAHIRGTAEGLDLNPEGNPPDSQKWRELLDEAVRRGCSREEFIERVQHEGAR